ncbi:hypothetical protein B0H14DRAFT_2374717, partial [Mycena olivaceomarginata]
GVLFRIHRQNLEVSAEGFPPREISTHNEVVDLTEDSATLELLFQFTYPQRHPTLENASFEILEPLAEAAEKYQVFSAMNICHIRLRAFVGVYPLSIAMYAAKRDYPSVLSEVAPAMISIPLIDVVRMLPPYLFIAWVGHGIWARVSTNQSHTLRPATCTNQSASKRCIPSLWV